MENHINAIGFIPARLESTRLPRKLLVDLCGKPVLQRTWEGAKSSKFLKDIIIATDSDEIFEFCKKIGATVLRTPSGFHSGTDRIVWGYKNLSVEADFVVNIQGDEPFICGKDIDSLIIGLKEQTKANVSTLISKVENQEEIFSPAVVKVVFDIDYFALYFSRSPIPFLRDINNEDWNSKYSFYKHIGIYCFRSSTLERFSKLPPSKLELAEKLEQLRLLENGMTILCIETNRKMISIDTAEDLLKAKQLIA